MMFIHTGVMEKISFHEWNTSFRSFHNSLLFFFVVFVAVFVVGCSDGVHYFPKESVGSDAECMIACKELMEQKWCWQSSSGFGNQCECILLDCFKKVMIERKPEGFTSYSRKCFKNGVEMNCTDMDMYLGVST